MTSPQPRSLRTNSAYQLGSQGLVLGLRMLTSPFFFWGLGAEGYGILVLVGLSTSYLSFLELGLGEASVRLIAHHHAQEEEEEAVSVFWTSVFCYAVLGVLAASLLAGSSSFLVERVLSLSPQATRSATEAVVIAAVGLFVSMQVSVASSPARALERFDIVSRIGLWSTLLQILAAVMALHLGLGLKGILWGSVLSQALALGAYWMVNRRLAPLSRAGPWSPRIVRRLLRFGGAVAVTQASLPLLVHSEKVILGSVTGVAALPYYSVPNSLIAGLWVVPSSLGAVSLPRLTRLSTGTDKEAVHDVLYKMNRFCFAAVVPICALVAVFARRILDTWMGHGFGDRGGAVLQILCLALVVNTAAWPTYQLLLATGRPGTLARAQLFELVVHLPVCFLLVTWYGVSGAALSWLFRVSLDTALVSWGAERLVRVGTVRAVLRALGRPALVSLSLALPLLGLSSLLPPMGRLGSFGVLAGVFGLCLPLAGWLSLHPEERSAVADVLRTLIRGRTTPGTLNTDV